MIVVITIRHLYIQYKYETIFLIVSFLHSHQTLYTKNILIYLSLSTISTISVLGNLK